MAEVLTVQMQHDGSPLFAHSPLRRSSPSQTSLFIGAPQSYSPRKPQYSSPRSDQPLYDSIPQTPSSSSTSSQINLTQSSSFASDLTSGLSIDTSIDPNDSLSFPSYSPAAYFIPEDLEPPPSPRTNNSYSVPSPTPSDSTPNSSPDGPTTAGDDTTIQPEPSRHVDYLSHEWKEEDVWSSWRHIVSKRRIYGELSGADDSKWPRLENASWRTWAKQKYRLSTVSPDTLNWLKDCDVTWLYGPLQTASRYSVSEPRSEPPSQLSKSNSFLNKKPILKKRSASEVMLQKSISASSLVKQAAAAVQYQQSINGSRTRLRPALDRTTSDFETSGMPSLPPSRDGADSSSRSTSGLQTPDLGERKHIRFDDKVEQCIAVDIKEGDDDDGEEDDDRWNAVKSDDSSDEGVMMKTSTRKKSLSRSHSRSNFSGEGRTIAMLPSTRLKYWTESPDVHDSHASHSIGGSFRKGRMLSPSPSQETLRPTNPSKNFLLGDDDEESDLAWDPSKAYTERTDDLVTEVGAMSRSRSSERLDELSGESMRRTPSGMFMPYDEDEDSLMSGGIFGRVADTVNTAKDIAHVIWNVGWRR